MQKAILDKRKDYYFAKLKALLNTQTVAPQNIKEMNLDRISKSLQEIKEKKQAIIEAVGDDMDEYLNKEEIYESSKQREWQKYCPGKFGNAACFYVSTEDPTDILVHIQVHLSGDIELIKEELSMEDSIEKHLSIPGFNVNLVFVGHKGKDVFEVNLDPGGWPTNENWSGGYTTSAHELMHLMGLDDEYDRIEQHAENRYMPIDDRLWWFLVQMDNTVLEDAKYGIMYSGRNPPLQRHVCTAVGLNEDCVKARKAKFK